MCKELSGSRLLRGRGGVFEVGGRVVDVVAGLNEVSDLWSDASTNSIARRAMMNQIIPLPTTRISECVDAR